MKDRVLERCNPLRRWPGHPKPFSDQFAKEIIDIVLSHYPTAEPSVLKVLVGVKRLHQDTRKCFWGLGNAMARLEQVSFATEWRKSRVEAARTATRKLFRDSTFSQLPVLVITLALFDDFDKIFFNDAFRCRVFIGKGEAMAKNHLGVTISTPPNVLIELSQDAFDSPRFMLDPKKRIKAITTSLIHEMCHAYRAVVADKTDPRVWNDVDERNNVEKGGHGLYFRWTMGFCQRTLDRLGWPVSLDDARYPLIQSNTYVWSKYSKPVKPRQRKGPRPGPKHA